MKGLGIWALVFLCAFGFTFAVPDLGGNFFGVPTSLLHVLFAANLTLFLWLLARFVGKPMASFLEARRGAIAGELAQAQQRLAEAESLRDEVGRRLAEVENEIVAMKARAEREGVALTIVGPETPLVAGVTGMIDQSRAPDVPVVRDTINSHITVGIVFVA